MRLTTTVPVTVELREESGQYFGECIALHVFASGHTFDEMLDDLDQQVTYFYNKYTSVGPDQVTGLAARLRLRYVDHFRPSV
jgi:hypothetical protein